MRRTRSFAPFAISRNGRTGLGKPGMAGCSAIRLTGLRKPPRRFYVAFAQFGHFGVLRP